MGTEMNAEQIAKKAIEVAAEICVFTNNNVKIEKNIMDNSNVTKLHPKEKDQKSENTVGSSLSSRNCLRT